MNETEQNQNQESKDESVEIEQTEQLTVSEAITGVFTEPGETFTTIKNSQKKNYWIIPLIIVIVMNLIASFVSSLDPELIAKVMDKQKQKTREQLDEQVNKGALTKEQADQQYEQAASFMNPESPFFKIIAYVGSVVQPFILIFLMSLIYFIVFSNVFNLLYSIKDFKNDCGVL